MRNRVSVFLCILIAASALFIDQVIKQIIRAYPYGETIFAVPKLLEVVRFGNTGAAFSIFSGNPQMIAVISALLLAVLSVYLVRTLQLGNIGRIALALLAGGGFGNLIDRILFSEVTDYIRLLFIDFPVFNFADVLITLSVVALSLELMREGHEFHLGE